LRVAGSDARGENGEGQGGDAAKAHEGEGEWGELGEGLLGEHERGSPDDDHEEQRKLRNSSTQHRHLEPREGAQGCRAEYVTRRQGCRSHDMTIPTNDYNREVIATLRANNGTMPNGSPLLLLTTKGARSGQTRVNPLAFTRDGDRYVVLAS